ncbi:hypothetical protein CDL15_Pgr011770 [Punica granatum]|nr:hypothetical protein CDL15_Pgr011770 [Punica granatum]
MKVELGPKAPEALPGIEIIQSRCEWRLKALWWNSLQAGDIHSEQLRSWECNGLAELVVSCDAEVGNTSYRKVSFGGYTMVKLRKLDTRRSLRAARTCAFTQDEVEPVRGCDKAG